MAFPTEAALLARVALPLASHRQRLAAAGFAVEDLIGEPLEASHVALGRELAPGEYLVAVVRHTDMAAWAARPDAQRLRLAPDVLALPIPAEGSASVREAAGRVLLRRADGTGFAAPAAAFAALWRAADTPRIALYGGVLPEAIPVAATGLMPAATPDWASFDLMQGVYARHVWRGRKALALSAAVIAITLLAQAAILGADTIALNRVAAQREAELRAALTARMPGLPASMPLDDALRRAMPAEARRRGAFLPLMSRVSQALLPDGGGVILKTLSFDAAEGSLVLAVEAPDLVALQRAEVTLTAAGLAVSPGVATSGAGSAEVRLAIRGPDR